MFDAEDYDLEGTVMDAVQHPVSAPASRVDASKIATQGLADALRIVDQTPVRNSTTAVATACGRLC